MKLIGSALLLIIVALFLYGCITNKQVRKESIFLNPKDWSSVNSNKVEVGMSKQEILQKFVGPERKYYENGMEVLVYKNNTTLLYFKDNTLTKIVVEDKDTITDKLNRFANPTP